MDNRAEIREFLASRRAKITPEQAGLAPGAGIRRVPGLRREEVAVLAGVSIDWYVRLEKGHISGVSDDVLEAVARALQLDEAERQHLFALARAAKPLRSPRRRTRQAVRPSVLRILESMTDTPAFVRNGRLDVLAINPLGRALYAPMYAPMLDDPVRPANLARFTFLDPSATDFLIDWNEVATSTVAVLRAEAGRDPHNRELTDLVGELATRSEPFRTRWATHNVHLHQSGMKHFNHPLVGRIDVTFDSMPLPTKEDQGLTLTAYTAEPGSTSQDALKLLASWTAPTTGSDRQTAENNRP
ncbi:transcriptional regulator with XRE-family HTH domain [Nonomuraea thailandensis]|uniref:Transcriptional regulator with XRE-family HTH domain n=1 Tax=Nonomuraea thailandensis TaxID=1188745 RepID=A0A9X2GFZ8_9ACTN|nr:helix-turn-helix transcriptional regulator [Nonomuraea thailandensis]MCP2357135.1 transcriptional regulator with XRE-family HTH domain [Nonomuraea thailandensis]